MRAIGCGAREFYALPFAAFAGGAAQSAAAKARRARQNKSDKQAGLMRLLERSFRQISGRCRLTVNRRGSGVHIPRHAGSFAVLGLLAGIAGFGMVAGGHTAETLKLAGSGIGLGVDKIQISGNSRISEIDVLQALGLDGDMSLPALDVEKARAALELLPWVKEASVRKIYPDKLAVKLTERKPYAVWQKNGAVDIVDGQGRVIVPYNAADGRGLPFFIGRGAADNAREFLSGMRQFPDLARQARAYIRVADRRWDILLNDGLRIKLPEQEPFARLAEAERLDRRAGLFSRDITELDLRLSDRITVALGDEALARRAAAVKEAIAREKALKNGRRA